eukprot:scaffold6349_cov167-Amphora_coffeaeformis.AAC.1
MSYDGIRGKCFPSDIGIVPISFTTRRYVAPQKPIQTALRCCLLRPRGPKEVVTLAVAVVVGISKPPGSRQCGMML